MELPGIIELPRIADIRGDLTFIEDMAQVPFAIESVCWLTGIRSDLPMDGGVLVHGMELIVALSGSFDVVTQVYEAKDTWHLDNPSVGLLVKEGTSRKLSGFSVNAIALIVSSEGRSTDYLIVQKNGKR